MTETNPVSASRRRLKFNRRLDDAEKSLLAWLTINNVVQQTGCSWETAVAALEKFTEQGRAIMRGDGLDAYVEIAGHTLVHAERDWLAFHAHADEWDQDSPS
jgi:hypothetical protein